MKKIFAFALIASLLTIPAFAHKKTAKVAKKERTAITWIEDKPGPTFQARKIFSTVPDSLWASLGLGDGVPSSVSCFLLQTEGKTILLDTGYGAPFSQLQKKLSEKGLKSRDIRLIYLTHMHRDHIGGLLKDDKAAFPNADIYINRIEVEAWKNMPDTENVLQRKVLAAYKNHLHLFEAGETLAGGVKTIDAYGHTPGHTVFQKGTILVIGDLIHGAAIQLEHPEYCPSYDMDPATATASRIRIMEYARKNHLTMYGMHLPEPGYIK
ncbi:MBL fold metallo-hydrolase [Prevotella falsenii]|uniref:MBL fold metallo-hydrolase n=1 Tax=Prevotella falsenii TaxID=515414 RepID=UPI0018DC54D4|nr:MBL fold metallo-hydrolase [Prevotella falsenii]